MKTILKKEDSESVPLAGYGDRKGKPSTGVHDSIFVKAVALNREEYNCIYRCRSSDNAAQYY